VAVISLRGFFFMSGLFKCLLLAGLWALSLVSFAQDSSTVDRLLSTYRLGAGDVVSIRVLGEDDLKREKIRLSDAGTISFPIIGEIKVLGKRVAELEGLIADGLRGKYLLNPVVSVTIEEYRPFFVNGQVEKSGAYPFQPGLTIRKAVSIAGGFKERASKEKIFVIRENDKTQTPVKVDQSTLVSPGDIITVEESFF
jgi:polysaccharide export outer membrane protein